MDYREIFETYKTIAVYGMSKNMAKPSHSVPMYMAGNGYTIVPVNPTTDEISGMKCYHHLSEVPEEIDILDVFRPSADALDVTKEAIERKNSRGDIKLIWLQEGIINDEAKLLAEENGIEFVQDKCIYKEHAKLYR